MSITVAHLSTPLTWRGGERQLFLLARESMGLEYAPLVCCPHTSALEKECRRQGIPVHAYARSLGGFSAFIALLRMIYRWQPRILHAHDARAHTLAYWGLVWLNFWRQLGIGRSKVLPQLVVHRRVDFGVKSSPLSRMKYLSPKVQAVICVSAYVKKVLLDSLGSKSAQLAPKVFVVHSGVDLPLAGNKEEPRISPAVQAILHQQLLWRNAGHPIVGTLAALAPHKDLFTFLYTAQKCVELALQNHQLPPRFVILGEGNLRPALEQEREALGLRQVVLMPGFVPFSPELLLDWDLFLFTSKEEGLGSSVIDALMAGLPVVATRAGGIPELIEDGQNGILCPVADSQALAQAVLDLLQQKHLREQMTAQNVEKARQFLAPSMARGVHRIYQSLLFQ